MKEEKWKTLIRQKLQDYEETPPPELWNDLMKALPQPEQQRPATVHTRRRWLYGIETALGAAATLTALFWVFRYPTTVPPRASHTVVEHKQPLESPTHPHAQTADFRNKDTENDSSPSPSIHPRKPPPQPQLHRLRHLLRNEKRPTPPPRRTPTGKSARKYARLPHAPKQLHMQPQEQTDTPAARPRSAGKWEPMPAETILMPRKGKKAETS